MRVIILTFLILSTVIKAEQVHSDATPSKQLSEVLKLKIPRFKTSESSLEKVIELLRLESIKRDSQLGVNIIIIRKSNERKGPEEAEEIEDDPFADDPFGESTDFEREPALKYNFDFENMPVGEIIRYVSLAGGLQYRIDKDAVVIGARGVKLEAKKKWTKQGFKNKIEDIQKKINALEYEKKVLEKLQAGIKTDIPAEREIDKLLALKIPKIRLNEIDIALAADFLKRKTRELSDDGRALNIIVKLDKDVPKVNVNANELSVSEILKYMAEQMRVDYTISDNAVVLTHFQRPKLINKEYRISSGLLALADKHQSYEKSFLEFGITFPPGAKIKFHKREMKVTISNTEENHQKLDKLFKTLEAVEPKN